MRRSPMLLLGALLGCAGGWNSERAGAPAPSYRVTALAAFGTGDFPARYRRPHDPPGQAYVFLSFDRLCVVDIDTWTRARVGDLFSCDWRAPR